MFDFEDEFEHFEQEELEMAAEDAAKNKTRACQFGACRACEDKGYCEYADL